MLHRALPRRLHIRILKCGCASVENTVRLRRTRVESRAWRRAIARRRSSRTRIAPPGRSRSSPSGSTWRVQTARRRGEHLGLSEEELAFYDALDTNDSPVQLLG